METKGKTHTHNEQYIMVTKWNESRFQCKSVTGRKIFAHIFNDIFFCFLYFYFHWWWWCQEKNHMIILHSCIVICTYTHTLKEKNLNDSISILFSIIHLTKSPHHHNLDKSFPCGFYWMNWIEFEKKLSKKKKPLSLPLSFFNNDMYYMIEPYGQSTIECWMQN